LQDLERISFQQQVLTLMSASKRVVNILTPLPGVVVYKTFLLVNQKLHYLNNQVRPLRQPFKLRLPLAGASTFHRGVDFGIGGGTPLYWKGAGSFKPGKGLGTIQTPDGYEIELLHTKGGKEASLMGQQQMAPAVATPQLQQTQQMQQGELGGQPVNIVIDLVEDEGKKEITPNEMLQNYIVERFKTNRRSAMSPMQMAQQFLSTAPVNYFG